MEFVCAPNEHTSQKRSLARITDSHNKGENYRSVKLRFPPHNSSTTVTDITNRNSWEQRSVGFSKTDANADVGIFVGLCNIFGLLFRGSCIREIELIYCELSCLVSNNDLKCHTLIPD